MVLLYITSNWHTINVLTTYSHVCTYTFLLCVLNKDQSIKYPILNVKLATFRSAINHEWSSTQTIRRIQLLSVCVYMLPISLSIVSETSHSWPRRRHYSVSPSTSTSTSWPRRELIPAVSHSAPQTLTLVGVRGGKGAARVTGSHRPILTLPLITCRLRNFSSCKFHYLAFRRRGFSRTVCPPHSKFHASSVSPKHTSSFSHATFGGGGERDSGTDGNIDARAEKRKLWQHYDV